jgi:hypothetical protein
VLVSRRDEEGLLRYAGGVRFGLSSEGRARLCTLLTRIEQPCSRRSRVRNVSPLIEVDVDYHGRLGGALRDPVLRELRTTTARTAARTPRASRALRPAHQDRPPAARDRPCRSPAPPRRAAPLPPAPSPSTPPAGPPPGSERIATPPHLPVSPAIVPRREVRRTEVTARDPSVMNVWPTFSAKTRALAARKLPTTKKIEGPLYALGP